MKLLVTGVAGFIGYHVAERLIARGDQVIGLDNLNDYYDVRLKEARLARLTGRAGFEFHRLNLADRDGLERLFADTRPRRVIHLAARPVSAIRSQIRARMSTAISSDSPTSSRDAVTTASSIWSTPHRVRSTARTRGCPSPCIRTWIIR